MPTRYVKVRTKDFGTLFLQVKEGADTSGVFSGLRVNRDGEPLERVNVKENTVSRFLVVLGQDDLLGRPQEYRQSKKYGTLIPLKRWELEAKEYINHD